MSRNSQFQPDREPMRDNDSLQLNNSKIAGPFSFLNPTQAHFSHVPSSSKTAESETTTTAGSEEENGQTSSTEPASSVGYKWTARDNRKGRHTLVAKTTDDGNADYRVPARTNTFKAILQGIWRMCVYYPVWDVSYLVATVFTWGSVVWVINAMFAFLPLLDPSTEFSGEALYGGGITAFIGATIFEFGSVLLMLEAINENRTGCFGWALERLYDERTHGDAESGDVMRIVPSKAACSHHHQSKKNLVGKAQTTTSTTTTDEKPSKESNTDASTDASSSSDTRTWSWWPSTYELRTHYLRELGFLACSAQMFGATVFWISGFTALPGIYNHLSTPRLLNGIYWVPQVIGGSGFIVSGTLFMLETQKRWYLPAFNVLGWHIGMWNLIGGIGFTLCPIFGFNTASWSVYQASCSTFWGSWAFLIGSVIQWYESLDKHPVRGEES